jgi:hypothetical protein
MKAKLFALTLAAIAPFVHANENKFEVSLVSMNYKEPGLSASPKMLRGSYEYVENNNLSYELMVGLGVADGSTRYQTANIDVGVGRYVGAFVKLRNNIDENTEVFARAGFSSIGREATATVGSRSVSEKDSGGSASFGVGVKYKFNSNQSIGIDFNQYYSKEGIKFNGFGIGITSKF